MPAQRTKSSLLAKYGQRAVQAAQKTKDKAIDHGSRNLPPGLKNAIAQLSDCKFVPFDAGSNQKQADGSSAVGELYLSIRGVIFEPEFAPNGEKVRGRQVGFMVPICPKGIKWGKGMLNFDQCMERAQNEMKKVGGMGLDYGDMDGAAAAIEDAKPFFYFDTESGKPDPKTGERRVFERLIGGEGLEGYQPADGGVNDESGGEADADSGGDSEPAQDEGTVEQGDDTGGEPADEGTGEEAPTEEVTFEPGSDEELTWLVEQAGDVSVEVEEGTDEYNARVRLNELGTEAGMTDDELSVEMTWQELADIIRARREEAAEAAKPKPAAAKAPTKAATKPTVAKAPALKVGDVRKYKPAGAKAPLSVEILSLNGDTCTLKNIATGKAVLNKLKKVDKVKIADLLPA